uniref:ADP-ribosyl cyclase/cyclic ADP-ribose hydrolase n=1 Tax=Brassica oleracea var. oleracea TaxID=109376 RepID=A0A0D3B0S4_BRAOL
MDSSLFLTSTVASAIGLLTLLRKLRFHQEDNREEDSPSPSSPSSSLSPSTVPQPSSSDIWMHDVFPSFRGADVRRTFLSHIQMEFERKGITPFVDNEIRRGESIGPELIKAIRGSKIAIILLSRNYASSKWCLDELVEIMKCREELGQTVMAVFYEVDPSDVKKLAGDFGRVFRKTCAGKTKECIERWRQAFAKVATIAGYHSSNWDTEAAMIKRIATDVSNMLNNFTPSNDFDGLVGMGAHLKKMEPFLCIDSDEVRMIGIWGPPGIGKTTIARVVYNQLSNSFQLSVFMDDLKANYSRLCSDDYSLKLQLQQQFMSQITNQKDMVVSHLGVASNRLKDKKVLVVLDGVDRSLQLDAIAKGTCWFGPGSRIIITTQDQRLFRAHGVNHIYKVDFPTNDEALQIFCTYSFGQKSPKDGFEELARKVTRLSGELPLGLRVMGSYFRGMSKQEWTNSLPRLTTSLNADIGSILKFSYDALDDEDKDLFLHIACFFNSEKIHKVEDYLANKFLEVRQRHNVLVEKSLISINRWGYITVHSLLGKLGREIVCKESIHEPGQRQFLYDEREIREVLTGDSTGSKSVIGIMFRYGRIKEQNRINKLEKLWEGIKSLRSLKWMDLSDYVNLKELPDLSTATNLEKLNLNDCSSLVKLPPAIGYTNNLENLNLRDCSSLIKLPSMSGNSLEKLDIRWMLKSCGFSLFYWESQLPFFVGNATNLEMLVLSNCSNLVKLPLSLGNLQKLQILILQGCSKLEILHTNIKELNLSNCINLVELPLFIGKLQKLKELRLKGCSKLEVLPTNINLESLQLLDLSDCSMLKSFPDISTNIGYLYLIGTAIEQVPPSIRSWPRLDYLQMSYFENLKDFTHALERITCMCLTDTEIQELPPWVKKMSSLNRFVLKGQVPEYFTHRATGGGPLTIKLNEKPLPKSMTFKACILLLSKGDHDACSEDKSTVVFVVYKNCSEILYPALAEHLYTF